MKIGPIVLFVFLCLAKGAAAQQNDNPDDSASMTREQWRARIDAAKARIQEMRREGKSFIPSPDQDLIRRILEDGTLLYGDIVATEQGVFQFVGKSEGPHTRDDFRQVARDRAFPSR
jgi:hypothetical protein